MTQGGQNGLPKTKRLKRAARRLATRAALAVLVLTFGLAFVVVGVAMWSTALAFVVLGVSLIVYALVFIDLDSPTRQRRR